MAVIGWRIYDGGPKGGSMMTNIDSSGKLRGGHRVADQTKGGGPSMADLAWQT